MSYTLREIWEVMAEEIRCRCLRIPFHMRYIPLRADGFGGRQWSGFHVADAYDLPSRNTERIDGERVRMCPCGCGYMVRNGWESLNGHGLGKGNLDICRYMPQALRVKQWLESGREIPDKMKLDTKCNVPYCCKLEHGVLAERRDWWNMSREGGRLRMRRHKGSHAGSKTTSGRKAAASRGKGSRHSGKRKNWTRETFEDLFAQIEQIDQEQTDGR